MVFECFLQESFDHGSNGLLLRSENTSCEAVVLFSSIWCCKRQSFDECQQVFTWKIDRSTNGRSLNAKFGVKLHMHAVCEAHPLWTPAFIWNTVLISYRAVKPPAFKWNLAFIQIQALIQGHTVHELSEPVIITAFWLSPFYSVYVKSGIVFFECTSSNAIQPNLTKSLLLVLACN